MISNISSIRSLTSSSTEINKKPPVAPKSPPVSDTKMVFPQKKEVTSENLAQPPKPTTRPTTPRAIPTSEPTNAEVVSYPETIYDLNNLSKRKPIIIECLDEQVNALDSTQDVMFAPELAVKKPFPPRATENLIPSIVQKPPPAAALLNQPTANEVKQSFIERVASPVSGQNTPKGILYLLCFSFV